MKYNIYADNAATTQMDIEAYEAMKPFLLEMYGNASQPYAFARPAKNGLKEARERIAACIRSYPDEIFFTSGGTESDNWAIKGFANNKLEIVTSTFEHHAVLNACEDVARNTSIVNYIKPSTSGFISRESLEKVVGQNTGLVSIMLANNEIGTIQPISELADIAHRSGALFHTDAVQAVGHIDIDVNELGIDLLSASAHKFNGPKGVGFLYVRRGAKGHAFISGGAQEGGLRAGTENVASIVGMSVALENNCKNLKKNEMHLLEMEERVKTGLNSKNVNFSVNGGDKHLPGLMSIAFPEFSGESLLHRLDLLGISVSTGAACNGNQDEISHVLKSISLDEQKAKGTIRVSFGKYNTCTEADNIVEAIAEIIKK